MKLGRKHAEEHLGKVLIGATVVLPLLDLALMSCDTWNHYSNQPEGEDKTEEGKAKRWKEPNQPTMEPDLLLLDFL